MAALFARTSDRSTATVAAEAAHHLLGSRLYWWIVVGVLAMVIVARVAFVPIVVTGLFWMVAGYVLLLQAPRLPEPSGAETTARVRSVTLVTKSPSPALFESPPLTCVLVGIHDQAGGAIHQVVQLQVPVPGRPDSLLAVDAVDSGSVAGLAVDAMLPVRYPTNDARGALLTNGTRTFVVRNRYHYLPAVIVVPLLGVLGGLGFSLAAQAPSRSRSGAPAESAA